MGACHASPRQHRTQRSERAESRDISTAVTAGEPCPVGATTMDAAAPADSAHAIRTRLAPSRTGRTRAPHRGSAVRRRTGLERTLGPRATPRSVPVRGEPDPGARSADP